ncbi:MAG TPA: gas vesicle protein GvpG [Solirubrobacteraceae bacterium]|nr:gas vesicle protein GvpG [Solirubrobacteraceae bacterium]
MGLIREVFLLPFAPVRGVGWLAQILIDEAERERAEATSPARAIEELSAALANGEISPEEAEAREAELIEQMLAASRDQRAGGTSVAGSPR